MDIKVAFSRLGIFVFVYAVVLGVPFLFGYRLGMWRSATWSMLILATAGPFVYLYLQRKAEERILKEELNIRNLLIRASYGMASIRNLEKLFELIIKILTNALRLDDACIYLRDGETKSYKMRQSKTSRPKPVEMFENDPLIKRMREKKFPVLIDELRISYEGEANGADSSEIIRRMNELGAHVAVPAMLERTLIGFVVLGERKDKGVYSSALINVLFVLGNQAALAIENCMFLERETQRVKDEGARARRESLDMLVSTMAHEIDNPLTIIIGQAQFLAEVIEDNKRQIPENLIETMTDSLKRIEKDSMRIAAINRSIEDYSKGGKGIIEPISIDEVLESYKVLRALIAKKFSGVTYEESIDSNLPHAMAENILVEEILVNFAENAFHAVSRNAGEKKVVLSIFFKNNTIRIEMADNGYGMSEKVKKQVYEVPTTTKGSVEGTGLGLYRVRQICAILNAVYGAESDGEGKGSTFWVELPVAETNGSQGSDHANGKRNKIF